jgi:hypothetical protein
VTAHTSRCPFCNHSLHYQAVCHVCDCGAIRTQYKDNKPGIYNIALELEKVVANEQNRQAGAGAGNPHSSHFTGLSSLFASNALPVAPNPLAAGRGPNGGTLFTNPSSGLSVPAGTRPSVVKQETPITAWRYVRIMDYWGTGDYRMQPINQWPALGPYYHLYPEMEAWCAQNTPMPEHGTVPDWDCSCGFYGVKDRPDVAAYATLYSVLAQVTFAGRVIEHKIGYRASWQRVDKLYFNYGLCRARALCKEYPTGIVLSETMHPACSRHLEMHKDGVPLDRLSEHLGVPCEWDTGLND